MITAAPALAQSRGRGGDVSIQATMLRLNDGDALPAPVLADSSAEYVTELQAPVTPAA